MKSNLLGNMPNEGSAKLDKAPNRADIVMDNAHHSKVRATADWVDGHISSKKHAEIHKRADMVLKKKGRM
jgi:hypothetical protein